MLIIEINKFFIYGDNFLILIYLTIFFYLKYYKNTDLNINIIHDLKLLLLLSELVGNLYAPTENYVFICV